MSKWDHSNCQILAPNMINPIREANIIREIFYTVRTQVLCKYGLKNLILQNFTETICTKPHFARYILKLSLCGF